RDGDSRDGGASGGRRGPRRAAAGRGGCHGSPHVGGNIERERPFSQIFPPGCLILHHPVEKSIATQLQTSPWARCSCPPVRFPSWACPKVEARFVRKAP